MSNAEYNKLIMKINKPMVFANPAFRGAGDPVDVVIPPLNTIVNFSSAPKFNSSKFRAAAKTSLRENWNWKDVNEDDSPEIKKIKSNISGPPNQGLCGSCFAVATANAISDSFVISKLIESNPLLSSTYILSKYSDMEGCNKGTSAICKCMGGDPSALCSLIEKNGIASDHCVDYSWCETNKQCIQKPESHFDAEQLTDKLNESIPEAGCYIKGEGVHNLYYIQDIETVNLDITAECTEAVKQHIYSVGPVIAGFHAFKNFKTGSFGVTRGIYFDRVNYPSLSEFDPDQAGNFMGGHAVVIIGWGIEKGMTIPLTNQVADVPYWYCRNSWGNKWGADGGYFKMAMYPFNKFSQFDKLVTFQLPSGGVSKVGGFILFKPTLFKPNEFSKIQEGSLSQQRSFYTADGASTGKTVDQSNFYFGGKKYDFNKNTVYGIIAALILVVILVVGYYYRQELQDFFNKRKSKQSKKTTRRSKK
jgi:hypothetical protein